jgi:hypothetical protein
MCIDTCPVMIGGFVGMTINRFANFVRGKIVKYYYLRGKLHFTSLTFEFMSTSQRLLRSRLISDKGMASIAVTWHIAKSIYVLRSV